MKKIRKRSILNLLAKTIGLVILILGLGTILMILMGRAKEPALANLSVMLAWAGDTAAQGIRVVEMLELLRPNPELLGIVAYITLIGLIMRLYLVHFRPRHLNQFRYLGLLSLLVLTFVALAWVMVPSRQLLAYLFPLASLSILLASLIDAQFSILVTILMGLVVGHFSHGSLELTVYSVMGGLIGILSLGRVERVNRLLWSGAYVALSNVTVVLIFHTPGSNSGSIELSQLMVAGVANGALSVSLALIGFFLASTLLGITTSLQLLDLARPTQPLLRQLLLHAPGTYHHSLLVSNLAEEAAERIGADALLTRVGAYYHDIGKLRNPHFFIENQPQGAEVQDQTDPYNGAQIIIDHVKDGLKLAKKYRLPRDLQAFIAQHHGTSMVKYFHLQALEGATNPAQVNEVNFRYPGPKPQSRETGVVMLADSCEAAIRAIQPSSTDEFDQLVRRIIIEKTNDGQLNECDLTMRDLELIHTTFVEMLQGMLHRRIEYPQEISEGAVNDLQSPPYLSVQKWRNEVGRSESITSLSYGERSNL